MGRNGEMQCLQQKGIQVPGKALGTEGRTQKAGQCDGHLNPGQKAVGVFHHLLQCRGGPVAVLSLLGQLHRTQRKKGNLRACKKSIQKNENDL